MIYFLYGENEIESREKLHKLLDFLVTKKPDASVFTIDTDSFNEAQIDELVESQGLFEQKYIVFLNKIFQDKKVKEIILGKLKEIAKSQNIFLFLENKVDKKTITKIEKIAEKVLEFKKETDISKNKKEFKIFDLADAFGRRDKKNLWVLYQKSKIQDISSEEVHGILIWQLKVIYISKNSDSVKNSGLNPFVFGKASRFAKNFTNEELRNMSSELISLYHNSRRGISELDFALEYFLLNFN